MIYLDNAATTKPSDVALQAYIDYASEFGNASSQYLIGVKNAHLIEEARKKIAKCINAEPYQIFFTSGGTESNNWAIHNASNMGWMISEIEHPSVINAVIAHADYKYSKIPVDSYGYIDLDYVKSILNLTDYPRCISVMLANNENGAVQPIKELTELCKKYGCLVHTDATQAMGHMPIDVKYLDVDMMSASGHKFGAFPGVGFLYIKNPDNIAIPFNAGGHQEDGLRGGTYNVPGIVGMANALIESQIKMASSNCGKLRSQLVISLDKHFGRTVNFNTMLTKSLPHILNFSIKGVRAEELVSYLDANDIYISSGSACTSGDGKASHVLLAMGLTEEEATSSIRISMNYDTTEEDINTFIEKLIEGVELLRR